MQKIAATEFRRKFRHLLERVSAGEEFLITRRSKAVARLVPPAQTFSRQEALDAAARIHARRKGVTLDGLKVKDLIVEGRS